MLRQLFVTNPIHFNADPTTHADVARTVEFLWRLVNQHFLNADGRRRSHSYVAVAVMIVGKHRKHSLANKPRRFTMRDFLPGAGERQTNSPDAFDLLFA